MEQLRVGLVQAAPDRRTALSVAVLDHPGLIVEQITVEQDLDDLDAVVVDAAIDERADMVAALAGHWAGPLLLEMPIAQSNDEAKSLLNRLDSNQVFSLNPLHAHLPTQRLFEQVRQGDDPLQTIFACWRFRSLTSLRHQTLQLLDYLQSVLGSPVTHISALQRSDPPVTLAILRSADGVVCSVEIGSHLPAKVTTSTDLLIECYRRESVLDCRPDQQAVSVDGIVPDQWDWSPPAAARMVRTFFDAIHGQHAPPRDPRQDLEVLTLLESIESAAGTRTNAPVTGEATSV